VKPIPENIEVLGILDIYSNFFYDGMSGFPNILHIFKVFEYEEITDRKDLLEKVLLYTVTACAERNSKHEVRVVKSKSERKK
jgi:hypothetical protein